MRRTLRFRIGFSLLFLSLTVFAMGGAFYLGKLYLNIVREGNVPKSTKVTSDGSKLVSAGNEPKFLTLNPVPVYFLQAGVYSDLPGAQKAAVPFGEMGYRPYITEAAPFKLWVGVYKNRADTETVKGIFRDKGFGTFTGSLVLNGENLRYNGGNEAFIKEVTPLLEKYTGWLKENLEIFHADRVERLNWDIIKKQATVAETVYKALNSDGEIASNNEAINARIGSIDNKMGIYKKQLEILQVKKDPESYAELQAQFLALIDEYCRLVKEIENISKT